MKVSPEAFTTKRADSLPPRIIGVECEYNIQSPPGQGIGGYINDKALEAAEIPHHGYYLGTAGGRGKLYVDMGLLEYATEERLGPASAAVADLEGIEILSDIVDASGRPHNGLYRLAGTYIPALSVEGVPIRGRTSGYHENYMMPQTLVDDPLMDTWVPTQLAARSYAMNGTLYGQGYVLSQKVWGIGGPPVERTVNRRTNHGMKPMLLIPPKHMDIDTVGGHGWARAEVRFAEAGQSLVARYAGFAAVSLALRVMEQPHLFKYNEIRDVSLLDPVDAAKRFAADMTFSRTAETIGGKEVTALDIQEMLLDKVAVIAERKQLPADEYEAINVLRALNDALRQSRPAEAVYATNARKWIDFVARHQFVSKNIAPSLLSVTNKPAMQRNLAWDRVLPDGPGLRYWAQLSEKDLLVPRIYEHAQRFGAASRALARAALIDNPYSKKVVRNWSTYSTGDHMRSFGSPYGKS